MRVLSNLRRLLKAAVLTSYELAFDITLENVGPRMSLCLSNIHPNPIRKKDATRKDFIPSAFVRSSSNGNRLDNHAALFSLLKSPRPLAYRNPHKLTRRSFSACSVRDRIRSSRMRLRLARISGSRKAVIDVPISFFTTRSHLNHRL